MITWQCEILLIFENFITSTKTYQHRKIINSIFAFTNYRRCIHIEAKFYKLRQIRIIISKHCCQLNFIFLLAHSLVSFYALSHIWVAAGWNEWQHMHRTHISHLLMFIICFWDFFYIFILLNLAPSTFFHRFRKNIHFRFFFGTWAELMILLSRIFKFMC